MEAVVITVQTTTMSAVIPVEDLIPQCMHCIYVRKINVSLKMW